MKRLLLILAVVLAALLAVHICPFLLVPALIILVPVLICGGVLLALVLVLLTLALGLLAILSPLWLPVLAVCGLIALVRHAHPRNA